MKIAIIGTVSSSIFGFRRQLLERLSANGHDVHIFTTDLTPDIASEAEKRLGIHAHRYTISRTGLNPVIDTMNTLRLAKLLRELAPDLVFSYFSKPVIFGTIASKLAGVKIRYGMLEGLGHYFTEGSQGSALKKNVIRSTQILLFKLIAPMLNGLIVLNHDDKKDLIDKYHIAKNKCYVLGGIGVDLNEYPYSFPPSDKITFVFVGRLLAEKGINEFLKAAEETKGKHPESQFWVLGRLDRENPGSVNPEYLFHLRDSGIIHYPGPVSNVAEWLQAASVFVLPSYYREGVPRTSQEAMAVGRPVITTNGPGCKETVEEGVNGFKVSPHSPEELMSAMEKFIKRPELLESMGCASRAKAEREYNVHEVNQRLLRYMQLE